MAGSYNQISDSLHVYDKDAADVDASEPFETSANTDSLSLPKEVSDRGFALLAARMDALREPTLPEPEIVRLARRDSLPGELHNLLLIVAADCARRRRWPDVAQQLASECQNPALRLLWERWYARQHPSSGT